MLGSFSSSHEEEDGPSSDLQYQIPQPSSRAFIPPAIQMRQLLISCAELVSQSDFSAARRLLSILSSNSSPYGDSTERLVHQFSTALSLRLSRYAAAPTGGGGGGAMLLSASVANSANANTSMIPAAAAASDSVETFHSTYLSLNQITPFIRFSQLTANQAILEAVEGQRAIHILDFDIMHGVQWPPLMQAIVERCNDLHPPPMIRITGTGEDLGILERTGDRLLKFAQSLGLKFQFHPLLFHQNDVTSTSTSVPLYLLPSALHLLPDETLAVNCVLYLHRLLKEDSRDLLHLFLHKIKSLEPKVVTIAEREANHNHPLFLQRFVEALDHYTAVFDSLEATLPPNSRERLAVERIWFGREIMDIVAAEGDNRRERHERFESWEVMLRSSGFSNVPLSPFALSQAKLLLRLHYPSEGYRLQIINDTFCLGWQNQGLFSVSSWH